MGKKVRNSHVIIGCCLRERTILRSRLNCVPSCVISNLWIFIVLLLAGHTDGIVHNNRNTWIRSSTLSLPSLPSFTRRGIKFTRDKKNSKDRKFEVKMMSTENIESSSESFIGTSLASSYVIYMMNERRWKLMPIDNPNISSSPLVGTQALEALRSIPRQEENDGSIVLECLVSNDENDRQNTIVTVQVEYNHQKNAVKDNKKDDDGLISVLSRILVQSTIHKGNIQKGIFTKDTVYENKKPSNALMNATTTVSLPGSNGQTVTIPIHHKDDYNPCLLFQDLLPSSMKGESIQNIEMNDLVNQNGQSVGHVPRLFVHQYNLLHCGIGLIVIQPQPKHQQENTDNGDFSPQTMKGASLYCHRRTDTKRIFPSLYDMFVGGVCTAGEGLLETAYRELEEELGLSRKEAFSKQPLFSCICCTSYNRCVVAVYSYQFDQSKDIVQWQPEEVAWGELVPYTIVERAAKACIDRYQQSGKWPGNLLPDDYHSQQPTSELCSNDDEKVEEQIPIWDFVPDGLLVWEAWLYWCQKQHESQSQPQMQN